MASFEAGLRQRVRNDRALITSVRLVFANVPYVRVTMTDLVQAARLTWASVQRRFTKAELRIRSEYPSPGPTIDRSRTNSVRTSTGGPRTRSNARRVMHTLGMCAELGEFFGVARDRYTTALGDLEDVRPQSGDERAQRDAADLRSEILLDRALLERHGARWWSDMGALDSDGRRNLNEALDLARSVGNHYRQAHSSYGMART